MNPLLLISVRPKSPIDRERLERGLQVLAGEDPAISARDGTDGEVVIGGMGELHLEIVIDRLHREFGVDAHLGPPQVGYVETITAPADGEMKHAQRIASDRGEYAHVKLRLERGPSDSGCVFENAISGGTIPDEFMAAVEEGARDAVANGIVAGYPLVDVRVVVHGGSYHDVDSTPAAFRFAAARALHDAEKKAKPILLEPVVRVDVSVPPDCGQDVTADLLQRGGKIESAAIVDGEYQAAMLVPLAGMFGYAGDLRARTNGRGTFRTGLACYQPCDPPGNGDDRGSPVGAPLKPATPRRRSGIALPED